MQTNITNPPLKKKQHLPIGEQPLSLNRAAVLICMSLYSKYVAVDHLIRSCGLDEGKCLFFLFFCGVASFLLQYRESKLCRDEEGAPGAQNFKGTHRVHTDMRLRQEATAHIDSTKKKKRESEDRTENIHITYTQWGGCTNTNNNNILHSCESVTERTSWQPDKRRRRWGLWGSDGNLGGCCCGGVSQVSGVSRSGGPLPGHPIHRLPRPGQRPELWSSAGPQTD